MQVSFDQSGLALDQRVTVVITEVIIVQERL